MKHTIFTLLCVLGIQASHAESKEFYWKDSSGKPAPNTESMKSKDGFGGQFILTSNEKFYSDWAKPQTPKIDIASTLPRGKLLVPVVIFVNPMKGSDGSINVTYDLEIVKPDGSVARKIANIICADGPFIAPPFNLQLSRSEVKWGADENDPLGTWKFKLKLKDHIRGTELPLEASVEIVETEPGAAANP